MGMPGKENKLKREERGATKRKGEEDVNRQPHNQSQSKERKIYRLDKLKSPEAKGR